MNGYPDRGEIASQIATLSSHFLTNAKGPPIARPAHQAANTITQKIRVYPPRNWPEMLDAACPMIISSKVVQPTSWTTFSAVGRYDPLMPRMGLRETIVGTPYLEPTEPAEASMMLPIRGPASEIRSASKSPSPGDEKRSSNEDEEADAKA